MDSNRFVPIAARDTCAHVKQHSVRRRAYGDAVSARARISLSSFSVSVFSSSLPLNSRVNERGGDLAFARGLISPLGRQFQVTTSCIRARELHTCFSLACRRKRRSRRSFPPARSPSRERHCERQTGGERPSVKRGFTFGCEKSE